MGTRYRTKTNTTTKEQSRMDNPETGNNGHKAQNEDKHQEWTIQKHG